MKTTEEQVKKLIPEMLRKSNRHKMKTSELIDAFNKYYDMSEEDKKINNSRNDTALSQIIRNVVGHQGDAVFNYPGFTLVKQEKASYFIINNQKIYETKYDSDFSRNIVLFGAPGTGKSYRINSDMTRSSKDVNVSKGLREGLLIGCESNYERVTFYKDYSYANFVGTYKPVPYINKDGKSTITYEYVPGPFMRIYVKAIRSCMNSDYPEPFLLIIEELNRADAASVFGDMFQLLDRDENGFSEYAVQASEDIKNYLAKELGGSPEDYSQIKIPSNMFIWATMNSADQGVFPMDTAFKRRWDFEYLGIDDNDKELHGKYVYLADDKSQKVEWNNLRKAINSFLEKEGINEDKQIGPYFISRNIVVPENGDEIDRDEFIRTFKNKVIMYLFEDAARSKRARIFDGISKDDLRYSKICDEFDKKGINIFNKNIKDDCKLESLTKINNDVEEI